MQETTLNSIQPDHDDKHYSTVYQWLGALYTNNHRPKFVIKENLSLVSNRAIENLESKINYTFSNKNLLINALMHSTFCYEFRSHNIESNERLEFVGDSLVNLLVGKKLFKLYPDQSEGILSKYRGALVNEAILSQVARSIDLGDCLFLGKGEFLNNGNNKDSILTDAFEALIAAIYFDSNENLATVENSLQNIFINYQIVTGEDFYSSLNLKKFDSKTQLQEKSMQLYHQLPKYVAIEVAEGFKVELWIGDKKLAEGQGPSKKKLEKELARLVLDEKRYLF